jgi:hypothetical protein
MTNKKHFWVNGSVVVLTAALIAISVGAYVCYRRLSDVNYRISGLADDLSRERSTNERLKNIKHAVVDPAAIDVLRAEVGMLKSAEKNDRRDKEVQPVKISADFQNAGRASPYSTAETLFWALNGGDQKILADSIILNPVLRERLDKIWESLAPDTKKQFSSSEELAATLLSVGEPIASMQTAGIETGSFKRSDGSVENAAQTTMVVRYSNGDSAKAKMSFVQTDSGWKWVVPMNIMMDKFEAVITGKFPFDDPDSRAKK